MCEAFVRGDEQCKIQVLFGGIERNVFGVRGKIGLECGAQLGEDNIQQFFASRRWWFERRKGGENILDNCLSLAGREFCNCLKQYSGVSPSDRFLHEHWPTLNKPETRTCSPGLPATLAWRSIRGRLASPARKANTKERSLSRMATSSSSRGSSGGTI